MAEISQTYKASSVKRISYKIFSNGHWRILLGILSAELVWIVGLESIEIVPMS
jgi:hypothetical protein